MPRPRVRLTFALAALLSAPGAAVPTSAFAEADPPPAYAYVPPPRVRPLRLGPVREGLTFELGVGVSHTVMDRAPDFAATAPIGLAPISFGVGGFVNRDLALSFRGTGTSTFQDRGFGLEQTVIAMYGLSLQFFLANELYVSGGLGLGVLFNNPYLPAAERAGAPLAFGIAANGRVGWNVWVGKGAAFSLYAEVTPVRAAETTALGSALGIAFQGY